MLSEEEDKVEDEQDESNKDIDEIQTKAQNYNSKQSTAHELLILGLLKASVTVMPLRKIQLISDAAWHVPAKVLAPYIDMDRLFVTRHVAEVFMQGQEYVNRGESVVSLSWSLDGTESDYLKFIKPWAGNLVPISPEQITDQEFLLLL